MLCHRYHISCIVESSEYVLLVCVFFIANRAACVLPCVVYSTKATIHFLLFHYMLEIKVSKNSYEEFSSYRILFVFKDLLSSMLSSHNDSVFFI